MLQGKPQRVYVTVHQAFYYLQLNTFFQSTQSTFPLKIICLEMDHAAVKSGAPKKSGPVVSWYLGKGGLSWSREHHSVCQESTWFPEPDTGAWIGLVWEHLTCEYGCMGVLNLLRRFLRREQKGYFMIAMSEEYWSRTQCTWEWAEETVKLEKIGVW